MMNIYFLTNAFGIFWFFFSFLTAIFGVFSKKLVYLFLGFFILNALSYICAGQGNAVCLVQPDHSLGVVTLSYEALGNEESVLLPAIWLEFLRLQEVGDGLWEAGRGRRGEQRGGHLPLYP